MLEKKAETTTGMLRMEEIQSQVLNKLEELASVLTNLRYEGRFMFGKNLRAAQESSNFLRRVVLPYMDAEDKIIFPFLEAHIPRFSPLIRLMRSQHLEFKSNLERFNDAVCALVKEGYPLDSNKTLEAACQTGTYLIYFLRHHIQTEKEGIYRVCAAELRSDEKKELEKQISCHKSEKKVELLYE